MSKKQKPTILYRADGAEFHLQSNGKYVLSKSCLDNPHQYNIDLLDPEFFSTALQEAQEKERHRKIGFRWLVSEWERFDPVLQKYDVEEQIWIEIPCIYVDDTDL